MIQNVPPEAKKFLLGVQPPLVERVRGNVKVQNTVEGRLQDKGFARQKRKCIHISVNNRPVVKRGVVGLEGRYD